MIQIKDKARCCGCAACVNICPKKCISLETDEEGFRYPRVDSDACIGCGLCEKVCIYLEEDKKAVSSNDIESYAVYNSNYQEREVSSSGGVFVLFAKAIIERGGVVLGTKYDKINGAAFEVIDKIEDLHRLQGSKYIQSYTGNCYEIVKEKLDKNILVLFSGTPCQIKALKKFLSNKQYGNLYSLDIFCHGVPGVKVYSEYKRWLENNYGNEIRNINFRNKDDGWQNYSVLVNFEDGQVYKRPFREDPYMKIFLKDIALRLSCYSCISKSDCMQSDITIGDFWGCDEICPEMNDKMGLSAIIVRSKKGQALLDFVKNQVVIKAVNISDVAQGNPALISSVKQKGDRKDFFDRLGKEDFESIAKDITKQSIVEKIKNKLWNIKNIILRKNKK